MEVAQFWCDRQGASATICRSGQVVMRYWYDGGLQYLEY